jgi:hypothetical protein
MRWIVYLLVLLATTSHASAQYRISVLTCGTGQDLYSIYGHSAVRVVDSLRGTDVVYNYGTFNFSDPDFYMKFTRGKLPYYLNDESFPDFMGIYQAEGRSVYEQVLQLPAGDAVRVQDFLLNNLKPENKYYRYDFLFDNCSTRIRDLFAKVLGKRLEYGQAIAPDSVSFRTLLNHYERNLHWERVGINLLMSHRVDEKMNSEHSMFLPDYLMKGFATARLDGSPLVPQTLQLLPEPGFPADTPNQPANIFWGLLLVVVLLSLFPAMRVPLLLFDTLFFMILGLLGFLMLFMWFGTEHAVCAWNRNLLWAFPLHLGLAFFIPRGGRTWTRQYARLCGILILLALLHNLFALQRFDPAFTPLILLAFLRLNRHSRGPAEWNIRRVNMGR